MRDPVRLDLIKDDSPYQREAKTKEADGDETPYSPEVFKLTENSPTSAPASS